MLTRRQRTFQGMSAEALIGLAAGWSGAVSGLLLIMVLVRMFGSGIVS